MAGHSCQWFLVGFGLPQVEREVIGARDQPFASVGIEEIVDFLVAFESHALQCGLVERIMIIGGLFFRWLVEARTKNVVCRQRQCVHPMRMSVQCSAEHAIGRTPDFDRPILRGGIEQILSAPFDTRDGCAVATERQDCFEEMRVPDLDRAIFTARCEHAARAVQMQWLPTQGIDPLTVTGE